MKRMALKFLNKKGWHTGSLRNIENVWTNEQKHDAKQKKLEELRKQIYEEQEVCESRLLQEEDSFVPRLERLDFLYESGLAVGNSSEGCPRPTVQLSALTTQLPRSQLFNFPDDSSSDDASVSSS